jgi:uncharacterized protein
MTAAPVTVSITRHIDPDHTEEMIAWVEAGASLAKGFEGFLGVGWMRPRESSDEWHMLYRFASREALATWESSPQRAWWLAAALGRIGESRLERRTGIEGWFDSPHSVETIETAPSADRPPPVWKQAIVIWLAFFPLSLLMTWLTGRFLPDVPLVLRVFGSTVAMTPIMTYLVLPRMTRALGWWLHR